jgi:Pentapeptide repeats (8 copies)
VLVGAAAALRQVKIASEGQVTERFTRAVDQLGHESLDVRLGGIYALERITGDSERDRSTIAEILTAFVRGHAPWPPSRPGQPHKDLAVEDIAPLQRWAPDVQAALTVLGRREPAFGPDLDLRHTDLRGANLRRAYLEDAVLEGARLQKANLSHAQLRAAHLENAQLQGALLYGARMRSASLTGAQLQGASCMTPSCTLPTLTRRSSKARCMTSAQPGQRTSTQARPEPPSTGPRLSCLRPPDQASYPTQAVHHRRTATDNPMPGRSSARFNPAQARGLGSLLRHDILSPVGMLPGLGSPWATLIRELPVHARDLLLGLGHCLRRPGNPLPQRLALRLRLLGSLEHIGAVDVRVRHDRTGTPSRPSPIPAPDGVTGATSGPYPLRASGTTAVTSGRSIPQLSSFLRSAPQVLGPARFSLAWRKSPGSQSVVGR